MIHDDDVNLFFNYLADTLQALTRIADALEDQDAPPPQRGRPEVAEADYDAGNVTRPSELFTDVDLEEVSNTLLLGIPILDHSKEEIAAAALHYERQWRDEMNARTRSLL